MAHKYKSAITIVAVILLGVALQVVLSFAEIKDSPNKAVVEFAKAYYKFDPVMKDRLSSKLAEDPEQDYVANYIHRKYEEARDRGYSLNYLKTRLTDISTNTLSRDENSAVIELTAKSRYALRTFFTGDRFEVHETFQVVKENGEWKVCGNPFFIAGADKFRDPV